MRQRVEVGQVARPETGGAEVAKGWSNGTGSCLAGIGRAGKRSVGRGRVGRTAGSCRHPPEIGCQSVEKAGGGEDDGLAVRL